MLIQKHSYLERRWESLDSTNQYTFTFCRPGAVIRKSKAVWHRDFELKLTHEPNWASERSFHYWSLQLFHAVPDQLVSFTTARGNSAIKLNYTSGLQGTMQQIALLLAFVNYGYAAINVESNLVSCIDKSSKIGNASVILSVWDKECPIKRRFRIM